MCIRDRNRDDTEKETIYILLEKSYDTCPGNNVKIVIDDMNAQVQRENVYVPTIGIHGLHNNSNGNNIH